MVVPDGEFLRDLYNVKRVFGDKWALPIIVALADGPLRRVDILSTINSHSVGAEWSDKSAILHDSILTRTLRKMTEEGLLIRTQKEDTFPPRVYYSLRPEVAEFLRVVEPVVAWARRNPELVARAQAYARDHGLDAGHEHDVAEWGEADLDADYGGPAGPGVG